MLIGIVIVSNDSDSSNLNFCKIAKKKRKTINNGRKTRGVLVEGGGRGGVGQVSSTQDLYGKHLGIL